MKSSYKIALLLAAGLLVFVLGYYATQEPEGGSDDRVTAGPQVADAANAPRTAPASPAPAANPDAARPAVRPAPEPKSGDRFFEDLKRSLQASQNNTSAPSGPADASPPAAATNAGPANTVSPEPAPAAPTPGGAAARANGGLNLPGTPSPTPAPPTTAANTETEATPEPTPVPTPPPPPAPPAAGPADDRPFFGPGPAPAPARPAAPTPAGNPGGPARPAPAGAPRTYTIRAGDTFEAVAQRELGDGRRWVDIAQANPLVDPARLQVGQEIRLPGPGGVTASATPDAVERGGAGPTTPAGGSGVTYTVRPGDTLSGIAQQYYGSPNEWRRIFDANRRVLRRETDLRPGQELTIPPGGRRAQ